MKIALISCTKKKKSIPCPAKDLYSESTLFSLSYAYAKRWADRIYILSALHGLVPEDRVLAPYNVTLKTMGRREQLAWAQRVLSSMNQEFSLAEDEFMILAGNDYTRDLLPGIPHYFLPLQGMPLGARISFLQRELSGSSSGTSLPVNSPWNPSPVPTAEASENLSLCHRIHSLFHSLPRYHFNQIHTIPFEDGIYILFEKGETYHGLDRIVRVGTHTSPHRLKQRLLDHFVKENHDGSIFRKNVGKAMLNACGDPYLDIWTLDTSRPENAYKKDPAKNAATERRVTAYLQENFTFTVLKVTDKDLRMRMESAIIAALHQSPDFSPGPYWNGRYSPEPDISGSGLWLRQGLNAPPLTEEEFITLKALCAGRESGFVPSVKAPAPLPQKEQPPVKKASAAPYQGQYRKLHLYFLAQTAPLITLSFDEMEKILGFPLPDSAGIYPVWWSPSGHAHCNCWLLAGYKPTMVGKNIAARQMCFKRQ